MVRVNAGCKGRVNPSSSLKEEEKRTFKISHEAKTFRNSWLELQYRPYQKHDTPAKDFSPKALQWEYQLQRTATNLIHVDLT